MRRNCTSPYSISVPVVDRLPSELGLYIILDVWDIDKGSVISFYPVYFRFVTQQYFFYDRLERKSIASQCAFWTEVGFFWKWAQTSLLHYNIFEPACCLVFWCPVIKLIILLNSRIQARNCFSRPRQSDFGFGQYIGVIYTWINWFINFLQEIYKRFEVCATFCSSSCIIHVTVFPQSRMWWKSRQFYSAR